MFAIIGGTGANQFLALGNPRQCPVETPYGTPSAPVIEGELNGVPLLFLPRHGEGHHIPPHAINYRANLWALRECGATGIIALNAVGAIDAKLAPSDLALPDQILDYTWGRAHTFFDGGADAVRHVDFTNPYSEILREGFEKAATRLGVRCFTPCCYAATQGPRLESAAEIDRLERDGADIVGMTGMPEASLAREIDLPYVSLCMVANMAAGRGEGEITMDEIEQNLVSGVRQAFMVIESALA